MIKKIGSIFGESIKYNQIGNAYLQYEITIEKGVANAADRVVVDGNVIRLLNNAFAYCFKEASLATMGGSDIEHNKDYGQISTIMRALTSKNGDLLYHFDESDESHARIQNTSLKHPFINNHDVAAKKGKIKGHLPFERFMDFAKHLGK